MTWHRNLTFEFLKNAHISISSLIHLIDLKMSQTGKNSQLNCVIKTDAIFQVLLQIRRKTYNTTVKFNLHPTYCTVLKGTNLIVMAMDVILSWTCCPVLK